MILSLDISGEEEDGLPRCAIPPPQWSPRDGDWRIESITRDDGALDFLRVAMGV